MRAVGVGGEGENRLARRRWLCARPPRRVTAACAQASRSGQGRLRADGSVRDPGAAEIASAIAESDGG